MVNSSNLLINKNLIEVIKKDNYNNFIKHINKKKKKNNDVIINCLLKFGGENILSKYLKVIKIKIKYFIYLIDFNYKNKGKEWYDTFFQLFLYSNLNYDEANIIINHLIKKECWILLEYLHLYGFNIRNIELLYDKLPINKIYKYVNYGYNINEIIFINLIKKKKIDIYFLEKFSKYKYIFKNTVTLKNILLNISKFQTVEVFKYFLEYSNDVSDLYFKKAFINSNYNLIKYLLDKKYYFNIISIKKLLTCNKLSIFKNKNFNKKINNKNFEPNIIDILNIFNNKLKKKDLILLKKILKKLVFFYLNNNFFNILLFIKCNFNLDLKLSSYNINNYIINCIINDNLKNIKKILDLNIINTHLLYCNKKYMDISLIYNSKKIINFLHNKFNIICSNNVLNNYKLICNNNNNCKCKKISNSINYIKNLQSINYKLNTKILNISSEFNKFKSVKYLLKQNIKLNFKTFELALYNQNIKIIKYLNLKKCKYRSVNMIDRYLNYHKNYYYSKINNIRHLRLIKKMYMNYNCTASNKCIRYIIYSLNYNLFKFVNKKFNVILDEKSLINMVLLHSSFFNYINKNKINDISNIIIYSIDYCNIDLEKLAYILSNYTYMFSYKLLKKIDKYDIIENNIIFNKAININNLDAINFYIEKGYKIDKDYLFYILFNKNKKTYKYIINKFYYNIDINDINKIVVNKNYSLNKIYYLIKNLIKDFNICINEDSLLLMLKNYNNVLYDNYYFTNIFIFLISKTNFISNDLYTLIKKNDKLNKFIKYIKKYNKH